MAKYVLEILDGDRAGDIVSVSDQPLRIGRKSSNDVVLADEKTSGVHAEIVVEGDRHVLRDLGSTNGTFLDGRRVTEVVLTTGDVITIGRLRVKFRDEGAPSGAPADFAMHRLDASRLQKRKSPIGLLAVLVVLAGGGGGFYWWQQQQQSAGDGPVQQAKPSVAVAGNKLAAAVASCDDTEGWKLDAHGLGFRRTTRRNSGEGAFEAVRGEGAAEADFAIAELAEPIPVLSGRTLTIAAFVQTLGSARVGIRGVCSNSGDAGRLRFRVGTALATAAGFERVAAEFTVPPGCDRLHVELVGLLPDAEAAAYVDDVAVSEGGSAAVIDHRMEEGGQTLVGTGVALAIRSTDVTLLGVAPGTVPPAFEGLHAAGLCVLSDLGAELAVEPSERAVALTGKGVDSLEFVFPVESAGQVLARTEVDGPYGAISASAECTAVDLLLGNQLTRVVLHLREPVSCAGRTDAGTYRLRVAATAVDLVLGFRAERGQALDLLREARENDAQGKPGLALDRLRTLRQTVPQDSEVLGQEAVLRAEILARLDEAIARLQRELAEAQFFDTRGGFERVRQGVEELVDGYGAENLEGREPIAQLRAAATERLDALDAARFDAERQRLEELAQAFQDAGQPGLAAIVSDYKQRHLGK